MEYWDGFWINDNNEYDRVKYNLSWRLERKIGGGWATGQTEGVDFYTDRESKRFPSGKEDHTVTGLSGNIPTGTYRLSVTGMVISGHWSSSTQDSYHQQFAPVHLNLYSPEFSIG